MSKKEPLALWDLSEKLDTDEHIIGLLDVVYEEGDPEIIRSVIEDIVKARAMTELAKKMGITRKKLYAFLTDIEPKKYPDKETIFKALDLNVGAISNRQPTKAKSTKRPSPKPPQKQTKTTVHRASA